MGQLIRNGNVYTGRTWVRADSLEGRLWLAWRGGSPRIQAVNAVSRVLEEAIVRRGERAVAEELEHSVFRDMMPGYPAKAILAELERADQTIGAASKRESKGLWWSTMQGEARRLASKYGTREVINATKGTQWQDLL